jgi:hypothetical protein
MLQFKTIRINSAKHMPSKMQQLLTLTHICEDKTNKTESMIKIKKSGRNVDHIQRNVEIDNEIWSEFSVRTNA